jgi:hypothetical protein
MQTQSAARSPDGGMFDEHRISTLLMEPAYYSQWVVEYSTNHQLGRELTL